MVPNDAWAALAEDRPVTIVFDGSAVTSVAKGYGWRGWFGIDSTAMERAELPERERGALAEQFGVTLDEVPQDYGAYLDLIKEKGAKISYNTTMALLYQIDPADRRRAGTAGTSAAARDCDRRRRLSRLLTAGSGEICNE